MIFFKVVRSLLHSYHQGLTVPAASHLGQHLLMVSFIFFFLIISHYNRCEVVSHSGFGMHLPEIN